MKYPSPLKAVRLHCLDCCLGQSQEVRLCGAVNCNTHPIRMGKRVEGIRPLSAIKAHCKECSGDEKASACDVAECALHPFRLGKNPNRAGLGGNPANLVRKPPTQTPLREQSPPPTTVGSTGADTAVSTAASRTGQSRAIPHAEES